MKLYTAEEMRAVDRHAVDTLGVNPAALMETAGRAVAAEALRMLAQAAGPGPASENRVVVLVGKGNNGGDGLVAARALHDAGIAVSVVLSVPLAELDPSPAGSVAPVSPAVGNLRTVLAMGIPVRTGTLLTSNERPHLCIDALLGVGTRGAPAGPVAALVREAATLGCPILSVDIPTGLDASTGRVPGDCIRAATTVTFGCGKPGLYSDPGRRYTGRIETVDIGFPLMSVRSVAPTADLTDFDLVRSWLPDRPDFGNKGTFGDVLVIAGSHGMMGAAVLCSRATLRAGAGLCRLALPGGMRNSIANLPPEIISSPVPGDTDVHSPVELSSLVELCSKARAAAIGPGLGTTEATGDLLRELLPQISCPLVIDADALNWLSSHMDVLKELKTSPILTPHPGEMARLMGASVDEVQSGRIEMARRLASERGVIVVLKGAATVTANPSGGILINSTGSAAMATAGAGDVLTGCIAGLLAQRMPAFEAAGTGVFLHGLAGDLATKERGPAGILAGDIVENLPKARSLLSERS